MQSTNAGAVLPDPGAAAQAPRAGDDARRRRAGRIKMLAILMVCAAPVIASYFTYYVIRPEGRTNYGTLIEPLREVGPLGTIVATVGPVTTGSATIGSAATGSATIGSATIGSATIGSATIGSATAGDGATAPAGGTRQPAGGIGSLRGRWIMLVVAPAACDAGCRERLYQIRQVRLTAGKDRDRVERVWLIEDDASPDPALLAQHEGLVLMRAGAEAFAQALPATPGTRAPDHVYLIDPLGNLMMRFPQDADPSRMKKDLAKLLRASRVG